MRPTSESVLVNKDRVSKMKKKEDIKWPQMTFMHWNKQEDLLCLWDVPSFLYVPTLTNKQLSYVHTSTSWTQFQCDSNALALPWLALSLLTLQDEWQNWSMKISKVLLYIGVCVGAVPSFYRGSTETCTESNCTELHVGLNQCAILWISILFRSAAKLKLSHWHHTNNIKDLPLWKVQIALNAATKKQTWPLEFCNC